MKKNEEEKFLILLTTGLEDRGHNASLAFGAANASLAMGIDTTVFMAGDGILWGLKAEVEKVKIWCFGVLKDSIENFINDGGHVLICATCYRNCLIITSDNYTELIDGVEIGGFASAIEIASKGGTLTF